MRIRSTLLVLLLAGLGPTARADVVNSWVASRGVDGPGQVCGYGDAACNRCVEDVPGQVRALESFSDAWNDQPLTGRFRVEMQVGERLGAYDPIVGINRSRHIQGLARVPGVGDEDWLVLTRATGSSDGWAGFITMRLEDFDGRGGRAFFHSPDIHPYDAPAPAERSFRRFVQMPGTNHASGIQMLGRTLVVGAACEDGAPGCPVVPGGKAWVELWDLADPVNPSMPTRFAAPPESSGHYAAATRLRNGSTLVLLNAQDAGWFDLFVAPEATLGAETEWVYLGGADFGDLDPEWHDGDDRLIDNHAYQNASLVTECGSGDLYLVTLRQVGDGGVDTWDNWNELELFRLDLRVRPDQLFTRRGAVTSRDPFEGDIALSYEEGFDFREQSGCLMRGGSSVHVTPDGRMVLYCGPKEGEGDGQITLGEIRMP